MGNAMLIQLGTDDTELADDVSGTGTHINFLGNHIEVDPGAIHTGQDALSTEDHTVLAGIQFLQRSFYDSAVELLVRLTAPGSDVCRLHHHYGLQCQYA